MTKLEKLILVNELARADINSEIKSSNLLPINQILRLWYGLNGLFIVPWLSLL